MYLDFVDLHAERREIIPLVHDWVVPSWSATRAEKRKLKSRGWGYNPRLRGWYHRA
jgi:hypothetical protein